MWAIQGPSLGQDARWYGESFERSSNVTKDDLLDWIGPNDDSSGSESSTEGSLGENNVDADSDDEPVTPRLILTLEDT